MKSFVCSVLLFLLALVPAYLVGIFLWGSLMPSQIGSNLKPLGLPGNLYDRLREVREVRDVDLLFLGSSHAYRGFDPRIFAGAGLRSFNLGSSGQTPMQTQVLLKRYLDSLNPRIVVFEVFPEIFCLDGVEAALDLLENDRVDRAATEMALRMNHLKVYSSLIYGWERDLLRMNLRQPPVYKEDTYITGGYVERTPPFGEAPELHRTPPFGEAPELHRIPGGPQLRAFEVIISTLKEKGIDYLLVYTPVTSAYYHGYTGNEAFGQVIGRYGRYYDFNTRLKLDDARHFYDANHLNQAGVTLFNHALLRLLHSEALVHPVPPSP